MKMRTLFTSLFAIITLVVSQLSFAMELAPSVKSIPELAYKAPTKWKQSFGKLVVEAAAFDPENKNKILLMLSGECQLYDLENKDLTQKIFTHDQNKTDFIKNNSTRPKQVGSYILDYDDKYVSFGVAPTIMLGKMVTVYDAATSAPLYTIEHEDAIKYATFNPDATQLITVSSDNQVKVSSIKKPITLKYDGVSIAINPDMGHTSQFLNSCIKFSGSNKSSDFEFTFEEVSAEDFNQIIRLMALVYKKETNQIKKLLDALDINSLCSLVQTCDFLQITNENIHLTDIICECIAHKYDPKIDQSLVKQLPPYCENTIAKHRIEPCMKCIDDYIKPEFSFGLGDVFLRTFGSNGEIVITGSKSGIVQIWDTKIGECVHTLTSHTDLVSSVAISSNGKTAATGSSDTTAKVWDTQMGLCLHTLVGHTSKINSVTISSDGERVVTGSDDKTAKIWSTQTGICLHTLTGHAYGIVSVSISSDSKIVVTGSSDTTIKIWDAQTGKCLHTLTGHIYRAISSDGKIVATKSSNDLDHTIKIWDTKTGTCLHTLTGHTGWVNSVAFSPDGKTIITGSYDNTAKIWDALTGICLHTLTGHTRWINSVAFNFDGKKVVTGSDNNTAKIWDTQTGECLLTLTGHTDWISSATFSSDGKKVTTRSADGTIKIWNIDQTAKREFLNNLTIEQADLLTETVYPVIKIGKKFEPLPESKEYKILMTISPKVRVCLKGHIESIVPTSIPVQLPHWPPYKYKAVKIEDEFTKTEKETREAQVGDQTLPGFFNTPLINKKWLWTGLSIGSFATAAATLFCYYKYFRRVA